MQPGDTRYLAPRQLSARWYNAKMKAARKLARPYFWWKRRPKAIHASEILSPEHDGAQEPRADRAPAAGAVRNLREPAPAE